MSYFKTYKPHGGKMMAGALLLSVEKVK